MRSINFVPFVGLQPLQINPKEDTVVIHYNSLNPNAGIRSERDALKDLSFDARIDLLPLDCKSVVKDLIRDILEAPLRKRNSLLGMLRMEENIESSREKNEEKPRNNRPRNQPQPIRRPVQDVPQEQPRSFDNNNPLDVISQTFSNFPGFQKASEIPDDRYVLCAYLWVAMRLINPRVSGNLKISKTLSRESLPPKDLAL